MFSELDCHKAAVGDLTQPAMSSRSVFFSIAATHQDIIAIGISNPRRSALSLHLRTGGSIEYTFGIQEGVAVQRILRKTMEAIAAREGIVQTVAEGVFVNSSNNAKALSLPGAVYGFSVRLSASERSAVFAEAVLKQTTRLTGIQSWLPLEDNIYPLYWGKDKMLGARIHQHLKNTRTTGLARLCAYASLHDMEIACVALTVTKYSELEAALQKAHPHLLLAATRVL